MAVSIKVAEPHDVLVSMGVPADLLSSLVSAGCEFKTKKNGDVVVDQMGVVVALFAADSSAKATTQVMAALAAAVLPGESVLHNPPSSVKLLNVKKKAHEGVSEVGVQIVPVACSEADMLSQEPGRLKHAVSMYEPVRATSADSRYFLVGVTDENLHVAIRYRGGKLSLRVEGDIHVSEEAKQRLVGVGMKLGKVKGTADPYMSVHFDCPDPKVAGGVVGVVLMSIGQNMVTPMPNFSVVAGK